MSRLVARKAPGGRVACGQPSCQRVLPGVLRMRTLGDTWLFLGVGWTWDAQDVWQVTERARHNRAFMAGLRDDARRHHADEEIGTRERVPTAEGAEGFRPRRLPVDAVCPHCRSVQRLDPESLGVLPGWDHRVACLAPGCPGYARRFGLCAEHQDDGPRDEIVDHADYVVALRRDVDVA